MQILHPFTGSVAEYLTQLDDPDRHRPHQCPQCQAKQPLTAHGFYTRTIVDSAFDGWIRVRRYLCQPVGVRCRCCRTSSCRIYVPALVVIALFLIARLVRGQTRGRSAPHHRRCPTSAASHGFAALRAGRTAVGRVVPAYQSAVRAGLRYACPDHARIGRLDPAHRFLFAAFVHICWAGPAVSFPTAAAPHSVRRRARLSVPTHHLPGTGCLSPYAWTEEKKTPCPTKKLKRSPYFVMRSLPPWCWKGCPAANSHAAPGNRRPPLRHPAFQPPPGLGGHAAGLDPALSPQRSGRAISEPRQDRGQARAVTPETAALIEAQAREPASYGRHSPARVGRGRRSQPSWPVAASTLYRFLRPRAHRTPTVARPSHRAQKV